MKVRLNFWKRWGSFWKYSFRTMLRPRVVWCSWSSFQALRSEACAKPDMMTMVMLWIVLVRGKRGKTFCEQLKLTSYNKGEGGVSLEVKKRRESLEGMRKDGVKCHRRVGVRRRGVGQASSLPHSGPAVLLPKVVPVWSTFVDNQLELPSVTSLPHSRVSLRSFNCRSNLSSYRFIRCYPAW